MDRVEDHRKVDTRAQESDDIDGREPELLASEWVRGTNADLDERYGDRAPASSPEGKY
jgi:hypothetical protein